MHHTLQHFFMNFLAKTCLFHQKFKTYLKFTFQGFLRRYATLFQVNWPRNGQCSNFKVKEIDQNMVASMFNNLKAKIHSESKNGYLTHCIPLKYLGFYVNGPFGTLHFRNFNKLFILQSQGHFFRYSLQYENPCQRFDHLD